MSEPVRLRLGNGAILLLRENPATPSVAFRGSLSAGAAYAPASIAEFTARLLLRATRRRSAAAIADAIEGLGSAIHIGNGLEAISIHGRCARETFLDTLAILVEGLREPAFPPAEVEKVRGEILGDIRDQQDDTRRSATRRLFELVYADSHPYHGDPKGDEASVRAARARDIRSFHEARGGASGLILAFSGDLDAATLEGEAADLVERIPGGSPPDPIPTPRPKARASARVLLPHKSQADFVAGRIRIPRAHPDYHALHLANLLFGRIGLYGRLGTTVRDNLGLAYYSFSTLDARLASGHWTVSAGVNPRNLARAMEAVRQEMERLEREPFTDEEIADGRSHLLGSLHVNLERNAEYAATLHEVEYFGLGTDYLTRYPAIVRTLKADAVRSTAKESFDPDACSWVVSGPVKGLKLAF